MTRTAVVLALALVTALVALTPSASAEYVPCAQFVPDDAGIGQGLNNAVCAANAAVWRVVCTADVVC